MPQNLSTKQVALMILGWSRDESDIRRYDKLEQHLTLLIPDRILVLDYRLFAKTCQRNLRHQSEFVTASLNQDLENLMGGLNIARNFRLLVYDE